MGNWGTRRRKPFIAIVYHIPPCVGKPWGCGAFNLPIPLRMVSNALLFPFFYPIRVSLCRVHPLKPLIHRCFFPFRVLQLLDPPVDELFFCGLICPYPTWQLDHILTFLISLSSIIESSIVHTSRAWFYR